MSIADRIRGLMAMKRIRVREMARIFRVTERTWLNWMQNPEMIPIGRLRVIAAKLEVSTAELIGKED